MNRHVEVVDFFLGSCHGVWEGVVYLELSHDMIETILADEGIELCDGCGWWFDVNELTMEYGEYQCDDCRES